MLACPTQVLVPVGAAVQLLALCAWRLGWLLSALRAPCVWAWGWLLLALCALPSRLSAVSPGPLRALNKLVLLQREQDSASAKTVFISDRLRYPLTSQRQHAQHRGEWGWYEVDKHAIKLSGCRKRRVCAVCAVVCSGSVRRWTAETDWRNLPSSCARTLLVGRLLVAPSVLRVWWWAQKSADASGREEGICSASHVLMADGASDQTNG